MCGVRRKVSIMLHRCGSLVTYIQVRWRGLLVCYRLGECGLFCGSSTNWAWLVSQGCASMGVAHELHGCGLFLGCVFINYVGLACCWGVWSLATRVWLTLLNPGGFIPLIL